MEVWILEKWRFLLSQVYVNVSLLSVFSFKFVSYIFMDQWKIFATDVNCESIYKLYNFILFGMFIIILECRFLKMSCFHVNFIGLSWKYITSLNALWVKFHIRTWLLTSFDTSTFILVKLCKIWGFLPSSPSLDLELLFLYCYVTLT